MRFKKEDALSRKAVISAINKSRFSRCMIFLWLSNSSSAETESTEQPCDVVAVVDTDQLCHSCHVGDSIYSAGDRRIRRLAAEGPDECRELVHIGLYIAELRPAFATPK